MPEERSRTLAVVLVATGLWLTVGITWGTQLHYSAVLAGGSSTLGGAIAYGVEASLPWIPATVAILLLARRYPLLGEGWRRNVWIHVGAILAVAFSTNLFHVAFPPPGPGVGVGEVIRAAASLTVEWIHVIALVYLVLVAAENGLARHARFRERELGLARMEARLAEARLHALSAQLRPHFLYNVLHTIGQLWRSGRTAEAEAMLDGLGLLFRRFQDASRRTEVTLEEELELTDAYLELERVRFSDRMRIEREIDPGSLDRAVPALILQPLVENAVRHGISADSSAGRIGLRTALRDGRLVLEVEDDGPGPGNGPARGGGGTGLAVVRERLAQLYGERARFTLEGGGAASGLRRTVARVELPARAVANDG